MKRKTRASTRWERPTRSPSVHGVGNDDTHGTTLLFCGKWVKPATSLASRVRPDLVVQVDRNWDTICSCLCAKQLLAAKLDVASGVLKVERSRGGCI